MFIYKIDIHDYDDCPKYYTNDVEYSDEGLKELIDKIIAELTPWEFAEHCKWKRKYYEDHIRSIEQGEWDERIEGYKGRRRNHVKSTRAGYIAHIQEEMTREVEFELTWIKGKVLEILETKHGFQNLPLTTKYRRSAADIIARGILYDDIL
jgi:hypothetical protein